MGIKGRRVHMIEELSETIISFQRGNEIGVNKCASIIQNANLTCLCLYANMMHSFLLYTVLMLMRFVKNIDR